MSKDTVRFGRNDFLRNLKIYWWQNLTLNNEHFGDKHTVDTKPVFKKAEKN